MLTNNNDLNDQSEVGINARKFFNQQVSLEGRVGFGEQGNNDYNSFGVVVEVLLLTLNCIQLNESLSSDGFLLT